MLPRQLTAQLREKDLAEWRAYEAVYGRLAGQQQIKIQGLAAMLAFAQGGGMVDLAYFVPWLQTDEQSVDQMKRIL